MKGKIKNAWIIKEKPEYDLSSKIFIAFIISFLGLVISVIGGYVLTIYQPESYIYVSFFLYFLHHIVWITVFFEDGETKQETEKVKIQVES